MGLTKLNALIAFFVELILDLIIFTELEDDN